MTAFIEFIKTKASQSCLVGAEIGVRDGRNALYLLGGLNIKKLYLVDNFRPYNDYGARDYTAKDQKEEYAKLIRNIDDYFYKTIIIKGASRWARTLFTEPFLDFVYIDANHAYKHVKDDLRWAGLVVQNGIIGGHDYGGSFGDEVKRAVDEFADKKGLMVNDLGGRINNTGGIEWAIIKTKA